MKDTLQELQKHFSLYVEKIGYNPRTRRILQDHVVEFLQQIENKGITAAEEIEAQHIQEHYHYLEQRPNKVRGGGLSSASLGHHVYALRTFFNYLEETQKITANPMSGLIFPTIVIGERIILTEEEIKKLYYAAENHRDKALLSIFYGCGLRLSEVEKLNINDVHFRTGLLYVRDGKGRKRRVIPMSKQVAEDLKNYYHQERNQYAQRSTWDYRSKEQPSDKEALLLNNSGKRMKKLSFRLRLIRIAEATKDKALIEKGITPHSLRHSISTHLLARGLDMEYIKEFLGHSYLYTTQRYTHISQEQINQVINPKP